MSEKKTTSIYIPPELAQRVREELPKRRAKLSPLIKDFLVGWLAEVTTDNSNPTNGAFSDTEKIVARMPWIRDITRLSPTHQRWLGTIVAALLRGDELAIGILSVLDRTLTKKVEDGAIENSGSHKPQALPPSPGKGRKAG